MLNWLQYIGASLCILAQFQRTLNPKWIFLSFTTSSISAIILSAYLILTQQWGLLAVEITFIVTNIYGTFKWKKLRGKI